MKYRITNSHGKTESIPASLVRIAQHVSSNHYRRYKTMIGGGRLDLHDLEQCIYEAWLKAGLLGRDTSVRCGLARTIAIRRCIDEYRRLFLGARVGAIKEMVNIDITDEYVQRTYLMTDQFADDYDQACLKQSMRDCIQRMKPKRQTVVNSYLNGSTMKQAGKAIGVSESRASQIISEFVRGAKAVHERQKQREAHG